MSEIIDGLIYCQHKEPEEQATFQHYTLEKGEISEKFSNETKIFFIEEGVLSFSFGEYRNKEITKGYMFLLPAEYNFVCTASEKCSFVILKMPRDIRFCDCFATQSLLDADMYVDKHSIGYLTYNNAVRYFLDGILMYIEDGMRCPAFSELKVREFFFIMMRFYSRKDLYHFFFLHLSSDMHFSNAVHDNANKVKSVKELADALNYSISGLHKHFKKVFGTPPYKWLTEQRARNVLHDINQQKATFKEISEKYHFNSISHFYNFCHKQFGATPKEIQKGNIKI